MYSIWGLVDGMKLMGKSMKAQSRPCSSHHEGKTALPRTIPFSDITPPG